VISQFYFHLTTQLYYGIGYSQKVCELLKDKGYGNIAVLVDEGVARHSDYYQEFINTLKSTSTSLIIEILRGSEEPDYDYLDEISERIRVVASLDLLIGIGGGSCLDITKAVAALKTNPGKGLEYRGFDKVINPGVPTLLIPTTAGTGSEATINAVFTDKKEMKKLGINGKNMSATYALLDAEWTMSCPRTVAVSSGMDAMTHTLESFMCNNANPLTRIYSKEAFTLLYKALPALIEDPDNREKRQDLLMGSFLAGVALYNSGSGISGALSYPIGVHYKLPHGIGGGIFIASVVDYNVKKGYRDYSALYDIIEPGNRLSEDDKNVEFAKCMQKLSRHLEVPEYLDQWGITKANVEEVAKLMLPLQAAFNQNPIHFSAESDALEMLKKHVKK